MNVDNFDKLTTLMEYESENDFYIVEVIKRRKENTDMATGAKVLKHWFLYKGDLERKKYDIIRLCKQENARAYLRVNRRNAERVAIKTLQVIANLLETKQFKSAALAFYSAACDYHSDPRRIWQIDVDDMKELQGISDYVYSLGSTIYTVNPTINGSHILCSGFDRRHFKQLWPTVDIGKDANTVLFYESVARNTEDLL